MKKIIIIVILANAIFCNINLLQCEYPYQSENKLKIILDDNLTTKALINQVGEVSIKLNLFSDYSYVTSPSCINCEIYSNKEDPFTCNQDNYCSQYGSFEGIAISKDFIASGNLINMDFWFDHVQVSFSQTLYVKSIHQLSTGKTYGYYGIGFAMDRSGQSSLISALYGQGKIDNYSYSLYYDKSYHLTIGGFNQNLISSEFYNLKSNSDQTYSPYRILNDLVLADIGVASTGFANGVAVLIDPSIDGFILPSSMYYNFTNTLKAQRKLPDVQQFTYQQPGIWRNLNSAPIFTVNFLLDDVDAISRSIEIVFNPEDYLIQDLHGYQYSKLTFDDSIQPSSDYYNVVRIGKPLFQKMMYYKFITQTQDGSFIKDQRCLAPLRKIEQA